MDWIEGINSLRAWTSRHRRKILPLAITVFVVLITFSVIELDLPQRELRGAPLLVLLLLAPLVIVMNALELKLCARTLHTPLAYQKSLAWSSLASVSNLLPVPAGLAVRGGALVSAGADLKSASAILFLAALIWLAMAATVSGLAIGPSHPAGVVVGSVSLAGTIALSLLVAWRWGGHISLAFLLIRGLLLSLLIIRLWLAFLAIDAAIPLHHGAYYAAAGIAGAVISIVPGGLGVSESFAALIGAVTGGSAAAAFVAFGLARIVDLIAAGGIALLTRRSLGNSNHEQTP